MNSPDSRSPERPLDPERLLGARLRATTPEFEARFDALQRQLAETPQPRPWWRAWFDGRPARHVRWLALAGAAAAATVFVVTVTRQPESLPPLDQTSLFVEVVELDETLQTALPLMDPSTLEALLLIPVEGGRS